MLLPHAHTAIQAGDSLLLVGRDRARQDLELTLNNENTLDYVLSGREMPGGWVWEWLSQDRTRAPPRGAPRRRRRPAARAVLPRLPPPPPRVPPARPPRPLLPSPPPPPKARRQGWPVARIDGDGEAPIQASIPDGALRTPPLIGAVGLARILGRPVGA
ncbi:MAG: hypothetical protein U5O69_10445 [Candidatus Competibacteraceae bacterium]|nr:hypothetical protein [Candidatus Competibacteraceae bacterium]